LDISVTMVVMITAGTARKIVHILSSAFEKYCEHALWLSGRDKKNQIWALE
jgi:hypothetical protein